jgi:hypothetical protein
LKDLVIASGSSRLWRGFASLGEENARWVLENYPGDVIDVAAESLDTAPGAAIPKLLARAQSDVGGRPERAIEVLSSWIHQARDAKRAVVRRRLLGRAATKLPCAGCASEVVAQAICLAISPQFQRISTDPGIGISITLERGLHSLDALREIAAIWREVGGAITDLDEPWPHLKSGLWPWLFPRSASSADVPPEQERFMRSFAAEILTQLSPLAEGSPGLTAGLVRLGDQAKIEIPLQLDPVFELLFPAPDRSIDARGVRETEERETLPRLALQWAAGVPADVASIIERYGWESRKIRFHEIQNTREVSRLLAASVDRLEDWFLAFLERRLFEPWAAATLERIVELQRPGWEALLDRCLDLEELSWTAASVALTLVELPSGLLDHVMKSAEGKLSLFEDLCLQRRIPSPTLKKLLRRHSRTATRAAIGEWAASPMGGVRPELWDEWRAAVLRVRTDDYGRVEDAPGSQYWLGEILGKDPDLALDWLLSRLADRRKLPRSLLSDSPFFAAIRALRREQRFRLLDAIAPQPILWSLLPELIGRDADLYSHLLGLEALAQFALDPLRGKPDESWKQLASAALAVGYRPDEVAIAA